MSKVKCDECGKKCADQRGLSAHKRFNHKKKTLSEAEAVALVAEPVESKSVVDRISDAINRSETVISNIDEVVAEVRSMQVELEYLRRVVGN